MIDFTSKRVLITGASRGLGAVLAMNLAKAGAKLALLARTKDKLEELRQSLDKPNNHVCCLADFRDLQNTRSATHKALEFLGGIDSVIHAAGGGLGLKDPLLSAADLSTLLSVNLLAAIEINAIVAPQMKKQKSGNLVHVGSIASFEGVGSVGYNTVKAALAAYVRSLGRELAPNGIIVTGIAPGGFTAPENAMVRLQEKNPQAYEDFINERLPRGVMGQAEELMPLILFLCSPQAGMMSGCMVPIDGAEGRAYSS